MLPPGWYRRKAMMLPAIGRYRNTAKNASGRIASEYSCQSRRNDCRQVLRPRLGRTRSGEPGGARVVPPRSGVTWMVSGALIVSGLSCLPRYDGIDTYRRLKPSLVADRALLAGEAQRQGCHDLPARAGQAQLDVARFDDTGA